MVYMKSRPSKMHLLKLAQDRVALSTVAAHQLNTTSVLSFAHFTFDLHRNQVEILGLYLKVARTRGINTLHEPPQISLKSCLPGGQGNPYGRSRGHRGRRWSFLGNQLES